MGKRVFLIILDSAGCGEAPDAADFDDAGSDTIGSCVRSGKLNVPTLKDLGLFNIQGTSFYDPAPAPSGCYGKFSELSAGKDTTVGHWEIAGMISEKRFPTYPDGFPEEIIDAIREASGREVLCNKPYSGTQVIYDYGREQEKTGALIVYTSADSVCQIAAHEEFIPLEELYEICRKTRAILSGEHAVARVIARPYIGEWPNYERTVNRHDFSLQPPRETVLDALMKAGYDTIGVGKIYDIFAGKGVGETYPNQGNTKNMEKTLEIADRDFNGICFVNLVDFDAQYGHRRDIAGYTNALNEVDGQLAQLMAKLRPDDLLIVSADHGCDPAFKGTDHTREYIPCLCYGPSFKKDVDLGVRAGFGAIAQTISDYFELDYRSDGESFLDLIR